MALQPAMAASSSSTGVKSGSSPPVPMKVSPPRALVALNRPSPILVSPMLRSVSGPVVGSSVWSWGASLMARA